jgi:MFS family permease
MKKYQLYCASDLLISAIGMSYFTGFAIGAGILPNYSDKKGRKWVFLASVAV